MIETVKMFLEASRKHLLMLFLVGKLGGSLDLINLEELLDQK